MKKGRVGGLAEEGELIEVEEMTVADVREMVARKEVNVSASALYGIMWFLLNKC